MRRSRHVSFSLPVERAVRPRHGRRVDPGAVGKRDQEIFVGEHMLEHPGEKAGLTGRCANLGGRNPGCGEKKVKPLRLLGNEGKRLNRQHFRRFPRWSQGRLHGVAFAFP